LQTDVAKLPLFPRGSGWKDKQKMDGPQMPVIQSTSTAEISQRKEFVMVAPDAIFLREAQEGLDVDWHLHHS
jgi:hypothetical protein